MDLQLLATWVKYKKPRQAVIIASYKGTTIAKTLVVE